MKIKTREYMKGNGIDVSKNHCLKKHKHIFVEPDNLYSLKNSVEFESLNFIYSKDLINETKFYRILIKEWLNFCKVGGHIIIDMKSNEILTFEELVKECKILLQDKGRILEKSYNKTEDRGIVVLGKSRRILEKGDRIDRWTFGILTDGRREDWTEKEIDSIINLDIPNFEIIVCGDYKLKGKKNVRNIPFKPRIAWITKKKNLICENARYENIVVTHNRFIFDKNWYRGIKKYGNYFEILSCKINDLNGKRADGWITFGQDEGKYPEGNLGFLEYKDWDKNGYIDGGLIILKKSVWKNCHWDEALIWGKEEDVRLSRNFYKNGFVSRFNPFSTCITLKERGRWILFKFDKKRFIHPRDRPIKGRIKNYIRRLCVKYVVK